MNYLVIDDDKNWLDALMAAGVPKDCLVECHSAEDATAVISNTKPEVIFLDHYLRGDDETGSDVVRDMDSCGITIYSTSKMTLPFDIVVEYLAAGVHSIEWIGKNVDKVKEIINQ